MRTINNSKFNKSNFRFLILFFSWEPSPFWLCWDGGKTNLETLTGSQVSLNVFFMLVQTSDQQTTEQQLTTIDRYCSSVICHLEFLHVTFQQLSKLLCLHIIISTQKSLYLRFYHCLWQLLNCISIILKNVEKFVMQQLLVGVWPRVWSYSVWFVFPSS